MGNTKNLVGSKIGILKLIGRKREKNRTFYLCECDCGNTKWIRSDHINNKSSCGCLSKNNQFKSLDILGDKFGRLTVIEKTSRKAKNGSIIYKCKCDCGNIVYHSCGDLRCGNVSSCGCLLKESNGRNGKKAMKVLVEKNILMGSNIPAITRENPIKSNTSGFTGVTFDKNRNKWRASLIFRGRSYYLGGYENKEDAIAAREQGEEEIYKPFLESLEK